MDAETFTQCRSMRLLKQYFVIQCLLVDLQTTNRNNMKIIEINIDKIIEICKRFHVRKLWVFGSILTPRFNDSSDVDLCVDFDWDKIPLLDSANNFFGFQEALESLLDHKIDITDDSTVRNPYFREELNETRQLIYG